MTEEGYQELCTVLSKKGDECVGELAFSADSKIIASTWAYTIGRGHKILLSDVQTGKNISQIKISKELLNYRCKYPLVFSSNGTVLAAGFGDGNIILWQLYRRSILDSLACGDRHTQQLEETILLIIVY